MNDFYFEPLKHLIGRTVESVTVNKDRTELVFKLALDAHVGKGDRIIIAAEGECCSMSRFEHVSGLDALLGQKVLAVVDRKMPDDLRSGKDEKGDHHECLSYYGWTIETTRGRCDLEMRNSSNGYYGGNIRLGNAPSGEHETMKEDF